MEGHECCSPGYRCNWYQVQANSKNELLSKGEKSREHIHLKDIALIKTIVLYDVAF